MSRTLEGRFHLTGWLVAESALHVGGLARDADLDLTLAEDGMGRFYVPGTSLAGVLRAEATRVDARLASSLFGWQDEGHGHASLIRIADAVVEGPQRAEPNEPSPLPEREMQIRDHVGIDRVTGAACAGIKFTRAVLPAGCRMRLDLILEVAAAPTDPFDQRAKRQRDGADERYRQVLRAEAERMLGQLAARLRGGIALGAGRSRGLGRVVLAEPKLTWADLGHRAGMLAYLQGRLADCALPAAEAGADRRLVVEVAWTPALPVMVKDGVEPLNIDMRPLAGARAGQPDQLTPVLPGSALKGALRSQAERILRTLDPGHDGAEPQRLPLIDWLFGAIKARAPDREAPAPRPDDPPRPPRPGLGALAIADVLAPAVTVSRKEWEAMGAPGAALPPGFAKQVHVAIDRWTGGAADQKLFDAIAPHGLAWNPIRLELDWHRFADHPTAQAALALLLLVLRDLHEGWMTLGFGGTRGFGRVEISRLSLSGAGPGLPLEGPMEIDDLSVFAGLPEDWRAALNASWQAARSTTEARP